MPDAARFLLPVVFLAAWVGHASIWTAVLNHLYGRPVWKLFLKLWRYGTGVVIAAFPAVAYLALDHLPDPAGWTEPPPAAAAAWGKLVFGYVAGCFAYGTTVFPVITLYRHLRPKPAALLAEKTETVDLGAELGAKAVGRGRMWWAARLPLNDIFRVDFTELTLGVPGLPPQWDGLTVHLVSDVHFHGTPAREWYDRLFAEIESRWPTPDVAVLAGDYLDTDRHVEWVAPVLGRLAAKEARLAVLGNHDKNHHPEAVRGALAAAGFTVLGNGWRVVTVRGVKAVAVGHEGPWFVPPPDLSAAPDGFRLCVSHSPDNFYWGVENRIGLMLCGHVHGGQIRVPVVGSIFVPSVYGRRFDMGVFERGGTVMAVGRGLAGKEPLRFRCRPQVIRLTLKPRSARR